MMAMTTNSSMRVKALEEPARILDDFFMGASDRDWCPDRSLKQLIPGRGLDTSVRSPAQGFAFALDSDSLEAWNG